MIATLILSWLWGLMALSFFTGGNLQNALHALTVATFFLVLAEALTEIRRNR